MGKKIHINLCLFSALQDDLEDMDFPENMDDFVTLDELGELDNTAGDSIGRNCSNVALDCVCVCVVDSFCWIIIYCFVFFPPARFL